MGGAGRAWRKALAVLAAALLAVLSGPAAAQTAPAAPSVQPSPVLTLDQDRLFQASAYGQRVAHDIDAAAAALTMENREIEAQLATEEKDLTTRRAAMTAAEFRPLADAFDAKVVAIRAAQEEKLVALNGRRDLERQAFYRAAAPVLGDLVRDAGAVAILDARAVFLSADRIDVTDEAIVRVDRLLGAGPLPTAEPAPPPLTGPAP